MPKTMVKQLVAPSNGTITFPHMPVPLQIAEGEYYAPAGTFRPDEFPVDENVGAWDDARSAAQPIRNETAKAGAEARLAHYDWLDANLDAVEHGGGGLVVTAEAGAPFKMDQTGEELGQAVIARQRAVINHLRGLVRTELAAYAERLAKAKAKAEEQASARKEATGGRAA